MYESTVTPDGSTVNDILPQVIADEHYGGGGGVKAPESDAFGVRTFITQEAITKLSSAFDFTNHKKVRSGVAIFSVDMCADVLLQARLYDELRYDSDQRKWFSFNGVLWAETSTVVATLVKLCGFIRAAFALLAPVDSALTDSNFVPRLKTRLESYPVMQIKAAEFNRVAHLLNTPAGVIDLKTGIVKPATGADLLSACTRVTPKAHNDLALCPYYRSALYRAMNDDEEYVSYMRLLSGYILTGETKAQEVYWAIGGGGEGKSALFRIWRYILHTYAMPAASGQFSTSGNDSQHRNDANIAGKRLVIGEEIGGGSTWNMDKIKEYSGDTEVTARPIYGKPISFTPQAKFIFISNSEPKLNDNSYGTRRRLRVLPFTRRLRPEERIDQFAELLEAEAEYIFSDMIEHAKAYYDGLEAGISGLPAPRVVTDASAEYIESESIAEMFKEACLQEEKDAFIQVEEFNRLIRAWAQRDGCEHLLQERQLKQQMEHLGFKQKSNGTFRSYRGLSWNQAGTKLKNENPSFTGRAVFG